MNKQEVREFFNKCAPEWDSNMIKDTEKIRTILYIAGVRKGSDVLDVACGTGVLFPDYFDIGVGSLTAIDLSDEMIKIARDKFPGADIICDDAENYDYGKLFDCIVIYNASPHFPDIERLISNLSKFLRYGGRLTIAHSMGPLDLNKHHAGTAKKVSHIAYDAKDLEIIFSRYLTVTAVISDDEMYQVTGVMSM